MRKFNKLINRLYNSWWTLVPLTDLKLYSMGRTDFVKYKLNKLPMMWMYEDDKKD